MNAAADQVMDLIFGRWRSQTLAAGTELGVFDHLDKRIAKSAETLATELNADPTLLYRLLRAQAAIGLLQEDSSRKFVLTGQGDLLRSGHPQSLKPMARLEEGPQHYALWKHLPAMVQDGKQNAFVREFGRYGLRVCARESRLRRAFQTGDDQLLGGSVHFGSGGFAWL